MSNEDIGYGLGVHSREETEMALLRWEIKRLEGLLKEHTGSHVEIDTVGNRLDVLEGRIDTQGMAPDAEISIGSLIDDGTYRVLTPFPAGKAADGDPQKNWAVETTVKLVEL